jgi:hypothetical protein
MQDIAICLKIQLSTAGGMLASSGSCLIRGCSPSVCRMVSQFMCAVAAAPKMTSCQSHRSAPIGAEQGSR